MAHRQLGRATGYPPCVDAPNYNFKRASCKSLHDLLSGACARVLIITALLLCGTMQNPAADSDYQFVPGQLVIKTKAAVADTQLARKLNRHGAAQRKKLQNSDIRIISVAENQVESLLASLRNDPEIEFAERDYIARTTYVPNDPMVLSGTTWHLARVQALEAWDITLGNRNVIVAVLDSGAAPHADLAGQLLTGRDFVNGDFDPNDDLGHGTAVTGTIIAAGNNAFGVAGVAFGCRVLPVKVVDASGYASYSTIAQGIKYAVDQGARVINLSIAGNAPSILLQDAVNYAWSNNVVIVASAGNNGNAMLQYPAACKNVIAVTALARNDSLASFSSFGSHVTLAAPGESIWTTQFGGNTPFTAWGGTSFASPIVAGVAALIIAENPSLPNSRVVSILVENADDLGTAGRDAQFGFGRVNAFRAVLKASQEPGALPPGWTPDEDSNNDPDAALDTNVPTLTVVSIPKNNTRLFSPELRISGAAKDDVSVKEVLVEVNGVRQTALGTSNWEAWLTLFPGPNNIRLYSVDSSGNVSPAIIRTVTYVAMAPLSLNTKGAGTVAPNLDGKLLEIGKIYKLRAVPAPGQAFAGWMGIDSNAQTTTFTMMSGLTLTASFVPSPFPAATGNYVGLIAGTNGVVPATAGVLNLTVTRSGLFTGKLQLGAGRHAFKGQLDLNGKSTVTVARRAQLPLVLKVHVDLTGGSDQLNGSITDGGWVSELSGDRNTFSAKLNRAPQAGSRGFYLQRTETAATVGSGNTAIAAGGTIRIKGKLADGRAFSAGSMLAKNGDCPLYVGLSKGSETVIGWLNFPAFSTTAASGTVAWVRTGTNAFTTTLRATSAAETNP
jgi:subtilisin family serine protease